MTDESGLKLKASGEGGNVRVHWTSPKGCQDFWAWLLYSWDMPIGWNGPFMQLRSEGFRILGMEFERDYWNCT